MHREPQKQESWWKSQHGRGERKTKGYEPPLIRRIRPCSDRERVFSGRVTTRAEDAQGTPPRVEYHQVITKYTTYTKTKNNVYEDNVEIGHVWRDSSDSDPHNLREMGPLIHQIQSKE